MNALFRRLLPGGPDATASELLAGVDLRAAAPTDRPALVLNMISSLDGRITLEGRTAALANRADYEMFHALRTEADAVMVGAGTIRAESYGPIDRLAVVVSRSLDLPPTLGLLRAPDNRVVIVTDSDAELAPCRAQVEYIRMPQVDLGVALRRLRDDYGVHAIDCEGGPRLNSDLLAAGLVDELHVVWSPMIVGGGAPLTLVEGPLLTPPIEAEPVWLLESGGYVFSRYRLAPRPAG